jgi:hypothetical protein
MQTSHVIKCLQQLLCWGQGLARCSVPWKWLWGVGTRTGWISVFVSVQRLQWDGLSNLKLWNYSRDKPHYINEYFLHFSVSVHLALSVLPYVTVYSITEPRINWYRILLSKTAFQNTGILSVILLLQHSIAKRR